MENSTRTLLRGIRIWMVVLVTVSSLPAASIAATAVYECNVGGQRIFSDQACAPNAVTRDIGESNRMQGHVITHRAEHLESSPRRSHASDDDDITTRKQQCNKLRQQQDAVVSKERAGYNAKQGERLRARSDELKARYQSLRCERYR